MTPTDDDFINLDEDTSTLLDRIAAADGDLEEAELHELIPDSTLFQQFLNEVGLQKDTAALTLLKTVTRRGGPEAIGSQTRYGHLRPATVQITLPGATKPIHLGVGTLAPTANGSILVTCGESIVFVTADLVQIRPEPNRVRYRFRRQESTASSVIPLKSRREPEGVAAKVLRGIIDHSVLENLESTVDIAATVLSDDPSDDTHVLAMIGASAALAVSDIPISHVFGAARVALDHGKYFINQSAMPEATLAVLIAGGPEIPTIVQLDGNQASEEDVVKAIVFGQQCCSEVARAINELVATAGRPKKAFQQLRADTVEPRKSDNADNYTLARPDSREAHEIRRALIVTHWLPRAHGSALVTIGDLQGLASVTLESVDFGAEISPKEHERMEVVFAIQSDTTISNLARSCNFFVDRALRPVLPGVDTFPYDVSISGTLLQGDGADPSLATCVSSLALLDAGVPLERHVASVRVGRTRREHGGILLNDLSPNEEGGVDPVFTVAGTKQGITTLELESRASGVHARELSEALELAKRSRVARITELEEALSAPRNLSPYAPRIYTLHIPTERIPDVIGPGGKVLRGIIEQTGVKIDIKAGGTVHVASADEASANKAIQIISDLTATAEVGKTYLGKVVRLVDFGAFVEIFPGTDGLLHISEIAENRVQDVRDELKEGDQVLVKVLALEGNKIKLSRKAVLKEQKDKLLQKPR